MLILWIKACHIIAMVCWFAGLFYLPRLFVYHSEITDDETGHLRFMQMERRLYFAIMTPSAIITCLLGFYLMYLRKDFYHMPLWLWIKLVLVGILLGYHGLCGVYRKSFIHRKFRKTSFFYRIFNEVPTVLLISIVCLASCKPSFYFEIC